MTYQQYIEILNKFVAEHQTLAIIFCVLEFLMVVLAICAMWILFQKAGEKGWKAIIPFYNLFTLCKLVWNTKVFWEIFVAFVILTFLTVWQMIFASTADWLGIVLFVAACICFVWALANILTLQAQTAYSFKKGGWFAVGLIFFNLIFVCILAFGKSQYVGNKSQEEF